MPIKVPRLVRDNKTGIFYFRYTPYPVNWLLKPTRRALILPFGPEITNKRAMAAMLNYGIEMSKPINLGKISELLKINISEGVFETDTEEEQERGLKIL